MLIPSPTREERPCPVCGSRTQEPFADERIAPNKIGKFTYSSRKHPEFMCFRLVRCLDCDLVYAPTPPPADFLSSAYSAAAYDSGPEAQAAALSYAKALKPHLARLHGRNGALDVGAGCGACLPWLCDNGFHPVVGVEPSRAAMDAASPEIRPLLRPGMFSAKLIADIQPSLICSFMTLEHLTDPLDFVKTAYSVLEPEGMLAVVVHNRRAPLNRLLGLRSPIIDVEHLQLYSPQSVSALFVQAGFTSITVQPITNTYPLRYWLRLSPLPATMKKVIAETLRFLHLLNKPLSLRVGNMLVVGGKPASERKKMRQQDNRTKKNVSRFDHDVRETGSYSYTAERLSAQIANARISDAIARSYNFTGKSILDLGCGDGTYTLEFPLLGASRVVGVDPAEAAIQAARMKAEKAGLEEVIRFETGNIYELDALFTDSHFDCIILRGVLHHLPDPARAIAGFINFSGTIVVLEPNGYNPALKLLEKYSAYHVEHEECSYTPTVIRAWFATAGFQEKAGEVFNLVPMFCPDWMARTMRMIGPVIERTPLLRDIACGQRIFVMEKFLPATNVEVGL